jgi:hypothetical protein
MSGAVLEGSENFAFATIDFVVTSKAGTLVFFWDWWSADVLVENQGAFIRMPGVTWEEVDGRWKTVYQGETYTITPGMDNASRVLRFNEMRQRIDLNKVEYIKQVQQMAEAYPDYDFEPWVAMIQARPKIDPLAEIAKAELSSRKLACFFLFASDNTLVDALVIDERGSAATAEGTVQAETFANQWAFWQGNRPAFADYTEWLSEQTPYGGFWNNVEVFEAEGNIDDIASEKFVEQTALQET